MLRITLAVLLAGAFAAGSTRAQPLPPLNEYLVRTYGLADGLPGLFTDWVHAGRDGYVYVGNGRGIVRFNGRHFEGLSIASFDGFPRAIYEDAVGRIWMATSEKEFGILEHGQFREAARFSRGAFSATNDGAVWFRENDGLSFVPNGNAIEQVRRVQAPAGFLHDSTWFQFDLYDGRRFGHAVRDVLFVRHHASGGTDFVPLEQSTCLASGSADVFAEARNLWIASEDELCYVEDGESATVDPDTLALHSFDWPLGKSVALPAGRDLHGLASYLHEAFRRTLGSETVDGNRITRLLRSEHDPAGTGQSTFWLVLRNDVTSESTVLRLRDGVTREIDFRHVHEFHQIKNITEDREGSLWFATDKGTVQLVPRRATVLASGPHLAEGFTTAILQSRDGSLWVGTWGGGLHRYADGRLVRRYTASDGLPSSMIRSIFESTDGVIWVGGRGGAAVIRRDRIEAIPLPTPHEVRAFAEDDDGTVWITSSIAVHRWSPDGMITAVHPESLWRKSFWTIHRARDGSVWIGAEFGLFRVKDGTLETFDESDGLRDEFVVSIFEESDGTLWFGTYGSGLHRLRPWDPTGRFTAITREAGLHSNGIWRILDDGMGGFWLSSDHGIARVDRNDLDAVADALETGVEIEPLEPLVFTEAEGMLTRESNRASPGGWRLHDGLLVFNSMRGVVAINPQWATRPTRPPRVQFLHVMADGQPLVIDEAAMLRLPPATKHVAFTFAALSFVTPSQNQYRYRLDGYDRTWIEAGADARAVYTRLPPGRYTLRVQGATGISRWSDETASLSVVVPPLLWQTWWFRLVIGCVVVGLLYSAYRYRINGLIEMERLRLRIASDLHDNVGSNLSSIALLSEKLKSDIHLDDLEQRQLARINRAAQETIVELRDAIWLVNPEHDTLESLVGRMEKSASDILSGTTHTFRSRAGMPRQSLRMEFVRNTFLIYKEALHNVAKHAAASHVLIDVCNDHNRFILRIRDDGSGFTRSGGDIEHESSGIAIVNGRGNLAPSRNGGEMHNGRGDCYGLQNMRRRAAEIGGRIEIHTYPGEGTSITFSAKMA